MIVDKVEVGMVGEGSRVEARTIKGDKWTGGNRGSRFESSTFKARVVKSKAVNFLLSWRIAKSVQ